MSSYYSNSTDGRVTKFFWKVNSKSKSKSRFNLLLLDYGEYFFEDMSVYLCPIPTSTAPRLNMDYSIKGRLKLCSRSLLFEPHDVRKPIIKYPFKNIISEPNLYHFDSSDFFDHSVDLSGFFSFYCSSVFEMKANDKIGPYQLVDYVSRSEGPQVIFALVHSEPTIWLQKLHNIRRIYRKASSEGWSAVERELSQILMSPSSFDTSLLVDFHETLLLDKPIPVQRVRPLELNPGSIMVTDSRVYFQPAQLTGLGEGTQLQVVNLVRITRVYQRRHLLRPTGLELLTSDGDSVLFAFQTSDARDKICHIILSQVRAVAAPAASAPNLEEMLRRWQRREISSFDYLLLLNAEAGRSLSDLAQYPVFPHILSDYRSLSIDLNDEKTFRDLTKPVGALNQQRLEHFKQRFEAMKAAYEMSGGVAPIQSASLSRQSTTAPSGTSSYSISASSPPPFLYGTHYSAPGYVLFYLARAAPEHMLCLQGGKFDSPDRMFGSMVGCWDSCLSNPADLKELIPEFFHGDGEFLLNSLDLDLGRLQQGTGPKLGDVELPPWSNRDPREFIRIQREALESDYVSSNLHHWIDLIFGYKQQGAEAIAADNLFYHLTYDTALEQLQGESDPRHRSALEAQIQEFGQCPSWLFDGPHPTRDDVNSPVSLAVKTHIRSRSSDQEQKSSSVKENPSLASLSSSSPSLRGNHPETTLSTNNVNNGNSVGGYLRNAGETVPTSSTKNSTNSANASNISSSSASSILTDNSIFSSLRKVAEVGVASLFDRNINLFSSVAPSPASNGYAKTSSTVASAPGSTGNSGLKSPSQRPPSSTGIGVFGGLGHDIADLRGNRGHKDSTAPDSGDLTGHKKADSQSFFALRQYKSLQISLPAAIVSLAMTPANVDEGRPSVQSLLIGCCGNEGIVRVWLLEIANESLDAANSSTSHMGPNNSVARQNSVSDRVVLRNTFPVSNSPLTHCCLSSDGNLIVAANLDWKVHCYSIPRACTLGQRTVHEDSISAIHLDPSGTWLLTGALDSAVRLWSIEPGGSVSAAPVLEIFDLDHPVHAVALLAEFHSILDRRCCRYIATGCGDGTVGVWELRQYASESSASVKASRNNPVEASVLVEQLVDKVVISTSRSSSPISSLKWLDWLPLCDVSRQDRDSQEPTNPPAISSQPISSSHYLLCGNLDGIVVLLAVQSTPTTSAAGSAGVVKQLCHTAASSGIKAIATVMTGDDLILCAGCTDGSLHGWLLCPPTTSGREKDLADSWSFQHLFEERAVHPGGVTSIVECGEGVFATGGEDGNIRTWSITAHGHSNVHELTSK